MPTFLLGCSRKLEKERRILIRKQKAGDEPLSTERERTEDENVKKNLNIESNFENLSNVDPHLVDVGKNIYRDIKVPNPLTNLFEEIFGNEKIISIPISWGKTNLGGGGGDNIPAIRSAHP